MDPLKAVEDIFGDVESWPSYVIYNRFVEEPSQCSVKIVAAFMHGNDVHVERAV